MSVRRSRRRLARPAASLLVMSLAVAVTAGAAQGADWYAGPQGKADNAGTRQAPWAIDAALVNQQTVKPGDTVYLLAGTYKRRPQEQFEVKLAGTEQQPVHIRPAPGERVVIDGGLQVQDGSAHLWIWDLEILVSEPNPDQPVGPGSHPEDFERPWGGLNVHGGHHCKFINLVIHNCRQGVSWWLGSKDAELHGCLIYDNGWPATDRGHGHAIYTQNDDGTKTISDNILTGGFSYSVHAYGSERAYVNNYLIEGNVAYDAGPFLVGGGRPSENIRVLNNCLYGVPMQIGYDAPHNEDCVVRDNVIVNGGLSINNYKQALNEGNLILNKGDPRPQGLSVVLRPNRYDKDRANLVVYAWRGGPQVTVPIDKFLKEGDAYRLMDPKDFFGKPVREGICSGGFIEVPVKGEFAAFVVLRGK